MSEKKYRNIVNLFGLLFVLELIILKIAPSDSSSTKLSVFLFPVPFWMFIQGHVILNIKYNQNGDNKYNYGYLAVSSVLMCVIYYFVFNMTFKK